MARSPLPPECVALGSLRRLRGWSVESLAAASGISVAVIYHYERGTTVPSRGALLALAAVMEFTPAAVDSVLKGLADDEKEAPLRARSPLEMSAATAVRLEGELAIFGLEIVDRARDCVAEEIRREKIERGRARAAALWDALQAVPFEEWRGLFAAEPALGDWDFVEILCERSELAAADKAHRSAALAELAVEIAGRIPGEAAWIARVEGWAGFFLANARRVQGQLAEAREIWARAEERWQAGEDVDARPFADWRRLDLEASLLRDHGEFARALACLEVAKDQAPQAATGRLLLKKAFVLEQGENPEAALATLAEAEAWVDARAEPRFACVLAFNRVVNLCHLSRFAEARSLVPALDRQIQGLGLELDQLRLLWLSGRISAGMGDRLAARTAFERVRSELASRKIDYDFAMVSLDLAALLLEQGEPLAVQSLAAGLSPVLKRQKLHHQARAAVALFCRAVAQEKATVELARRIVIFLRRAERAPGLCFEE